MENNFTKEIINQSEGMLDKAYDDIVHPIAEPVGQILSYLPRTIRLFFAKWEKWIVNGEENLKLTGEALKDKVSGIPEEKLCEPEPYVAIPAIQQIAYCYDSDELRDMYANLLAASMNTDKKWQVHPGYVDIIKQLTPDEARLLRICPRSSVLYKPLINLTIKEPNNQGSRTLKRNYTNFADDVLDCPANIGSYIDNLNRLEIIKVPGDMHIPDDSFYFPIENSRFIKEMEQKTPLKEGEQFEHVKKLFYVTEFGLGFINCCIDDSFNN